MNNRVVRFLILTIFVLLMFWIGRFHSDFIYKWFGTSPDGDPDRLIGQMGIMFLVSVTVLAVVSISTLIEQMKRVIRWIKRKQEVEP